MDGDTDRRIHDELMALQTTDSNAYAMARPDIQQMMRQLVFRVEQIDEKWEKGFRDPHARVGVSIQLGDEGRKWVWFDYIPYSRKEESRLKVCFIGKHRRGDSQTEEPGYPRFPAGMYDPTMADGRRFRLLLASSADVEFLLRQCVLETSFAKLGNA